MSRPFPFQQLYAKLGLEKGSRTSQSRSIMARERRKLSTLIGDRVLEINRSPVSSPVELVGATELTLRVDTIPTVIPSNVGSASAFPSGPNLPKTQLAVDIIENLAKFPHCILLTRVGNFYEASLSY